MRTKHSTVPSAEAPLESLTLDQRLEQMGEPELARYVREAQERRKFDLAGYAAKLFLKRGRTNEDNSA